MILIDVNIVDFSKVSREDIFGLLSYYKDECDKIEKKVSDCVNALSQKIELLKENDSDSDKKKLATKQKYTNELQVLGGIQNTILEIKPYLEYRIARVYKDDPAGGEPSTSPQVIPKSHIKKPRAKRNSEKLDESNIESENENDEQDDGSENENESENDEDDDDDLTNQNEKENEKENANENDSESN